MENKFRFYNTLSREVETVIPNEDGKIAMYTCGPTVYHFAHIGNLRSYIMEDILEKTLRYIGYDVKRVISEFACCNALISSFTGSGRST